MTRRLTIIALLSAVAFILMLFPKFPLLPGVNFLTIDFSIVAVILGALLLDLKSGYAILLLRSLLKLLLANSGVNDYIGLPMNIVAMGIFLTVLYFWVKRKPTFSWGRFIGGAITGTLALTVAMVALNYFFAIPLYAVFANFDIGQIYGVGNYLVAMVIPFNLLEGFILTIAIAVVYVALRPFIERTAQQLSV